MYLSGSGYEFGFKHEKINNILESDVEISDDIYHKFFEEQEVGKQFTLRNKNGTSFDEIFEEVTTLVY